MTILRDAFPLKKLKIKRFHFFSSKSCNIPLIQQHPKWCMYTFGPKPHLLIKYHIGRAYIVHCIWPLLTFDLCEGHHHPKLVLAILLTKFSSHRSLFTIFDLCWPLTSMKVIIVSAVVLTKSGSHSTYFTPFDLWWPLTSMKVTIIFSLHQWFFWPSLVVLVHCLTFLTPAVPGDQHMRRPKFTMRTFRPSPTHISNIIKKCSGQIFAEIIQIRHLISICHAQNSACATSALAPPTYQISSR